MSAQRSAHERIDGFHSDDHDDMDVYDRLLHEFPDEFVLLEPRAIVHRDVVGERVTWNYL